MDDPKAIILWDSLVVTKVQLRKKSNWFHKKAAIGSWAVMLTLSNKKLKFSITTKFPNKFNPGTKSEPNSLL